MFGSEKSYVVAFEDGKKISYATGNENRVRMLAQKWNDGNFDQSTDGETEEKVDETYSHHTALSESLEAATNFCLSQFQVIGLLSQIQSIFHEGFVRRSIIDRLNSSDVPVEEVGSCKIYEVNEALREEIVKADMRGNLIELGSKKIGPSVFLGMIASFDALIVEIVGKLIQLNPERYSGSDKVISIGDILAASSKDDIIQQFVADELYRFSRESHDGQNSYIERNFNIKIKGEWARYPDFIEIFERRNLIAHGESLFNQRYVSICQSSGHKGIESQVGLPVEVRFIYQMQALFILSEYAILLSFMLWRKHAPDKEEEAFETLNEAAFKLIQDEKYQLAERILAFALSLKNVKVKDECRKMMIVNRASAARSFKDGGKELCAKILNAEDWSATAFHFQISVAALRDEIDEVIRLLPLAAKMSFGLSQFRHWPVFRFIRDEEQFNAALEAEFGERISAVHETTELLVQSDSEVEGTVH